jgi:hypothetical protein
LELFDGHYYIKRERVVAKIPFGNRTFYAKFERIDAPLTPLLLQQHLNRTYTIAAPLLQEGKTNYLLIEYKGEAYQRFYYLVKHLMQTQQITEYALYQGKTEDKIQLFIKVKKLSVAEAEERLEILSSILAEKLDKAWKCLPSVTLPEAYHIVTLPYKQL